MSDGYPELGYVKTAIKLMVMVVIILIILITISGKVYMEYIEQAKNIIYELIKNFLQEIFNIQLVE